VNQQNHQTAVQGKHDTTSPAWDDMAPGDYRFLDDHLIYQCPCGCGQVRSLPISQGPKRPHFWSWDGNTDLPTVAPSIRIVGSCKWHGFLQDGCWKPCGDSGQ